MKILLNNTLHGLIPVYDKDFDEKKKLKIGAIYECSIKEQRNYKFHKKYFALINLAWEYQNETTQNHFNNNIESFRKTVEISAGHFERVFSLTLKDWVDCPKSISFDKMDNISFSQLYESVFQVLLSVFLKNITQEEFEKNLIFF
jgi:hypothetical protein